MNEWRGKIVWLSGVDKFCVWLHLSTLNSGFSVSREPRWEGESVDKQVSPQDTREQFTVFYTCWGNGFQKEKKKKREGRKTKNPLGRGGRWWCLSQGLWGKIAKNLCVKVCLWTRDFCFLSTFTRLASQHLLRQSTSLSEWTSCASTCCNFCSEEDGGFSQLPSCWLSPHFSPSPGVHVVLPRSVFSLMLFICRCVFSGSSHIMVHQSQLCIFSKLLFLGKLWLCLLLTEGLKGRAKGGSDLLHINTPYSFEQTS